MATKKTGMQLLKEGVAVNGKAPKGAKLKKFPTMNKAGKKPVNKKK